MNPGVCTSCALSLFHGRAVLTVCWFGVPLLLCDVIVRAVDDLCLLICLLHHQEHLVMENMSLHGIFCLRIV